MSAAREIERKFVVTASIPFDLEACPSETIRQGYLAVGRDGTEVRLRARGDQRSLGIKSGPSRTRVQEEIELDDRRFDSLWSLTEGRQLRKRRYVIPDDDDRTIELDVYEGDLHGLITAEIEFDSERDADAFEPPAWLGDDVTGEERYSNQTLAIRGLPAHARQA
jgi:CYTH domain-containing protein